MAVRELCLDLVEARPQTIGRTSLECAVELGITVGDPAGKNMPRLVLVHSRQVTLFADDTVFSAR